MTVSSAVSRVGTGSVLYVRLICSSCMYIVRRTQSVSTPPPWENEVAARFMPKRYTSRELVKLAEEFGWRLVGVRGDHHNFKHPASRFIVTIVHPQKDVPVGRAVDTVKKIRLDVK
jgi:predicted RNA binding protein YcfA (HicA-like mRNA interferase family)